MTNPPGLRANPLPLVVVGNPKRRKRKGRSAAAITTKPKDTPMATATKGKKKRASARKRRLATKTNPAKVTSRARTQKRRSRKQRSRARSRKTRSIIVSTGKPVATKIIRLNPGKKGHRGRRRARRNPDGTGIMGGFLGDLTGAFSEAPSLTSPKNLGWAAGGAATSMLAGALLAPQVAKYVPTLSLPMARAVNGLTYAVAGIAPAVLIKDRAARRRWILGALGMAISEALFPGWSSDLMRKAPVVGTWIPVPQTSAALAKAATTLKGLSGLGDFLKRPIGGAFSEKVNQAHLLSSDGTIPTTVETNPDATQPDRPGALGDQSDRPGALGDLVGVNAGAL